MPTFAFHALRYDGLWSSGKREGFGKCKFADLSEQVKNRVCAAA